MHTNQCQVAVYCVAPHGGAWIEIELYIVNCAYLRKSPLTEGRGLKSSSPPRLRPWLVAPHGGAWIEITQMEHNPAIV